MIFDTVVTNGKLVLPGRGIHEASLAIKDGKVVGFFDSNIKLESNEVIDANGNYVLPGVIDPHTHLGMGNGLNDYLTETKCASLGGVTTLINFLLTSEDYDEVYASSKQAGENWGYVDFSFHFGAVTDLHIKNVEKYIKTMGVPSFKLFMNFKGNEGAYLGIQGIDDGYIFDFFNSLTRFSKAIPCIHAENIEVVWRLRNNLQNQPGKDLALWDASRPIFVETENVHRAIYFAEMAQCPVYIVHISGKGSLEEVQSYKLRYDKIYGETCPHYLTHSRDSEVGILGKVNPPLRTSEDIDALWKGIRNGTINTVGSDHVPRRKEAKSGGIWKASAGFPGVGTLLPILLSEGVNKRGISIERIVEITSSNVAKIFSLYPKKGDLSIGSDADLVIIDLNLEKEVHANDLQSYSDFSIYESWKLKGWPVLTMVRGKTVMESGKIVGQEGFGEFIPRYF
jgi:dihydropyrimidinase